MHFVWTSRQSERFSWNSRTDHFWCTTGINPRPYFFSSYINNLLYFIDSENLHNLADENTLSDHADSINELVDKLEQSSAKAIEWMNNNHMIADPSKVHAIILTKNPKDMGKASLNIEGHLTKNETEVDFLWQCCPTRNHMQSTRKPPTSIRLLFTQRFLTFRCLPCVKIKDTEDVCPLKKTRNSLDGNYSFEFCPLHAAHA